MRSGLLAVAVVLALSGCGARTVEDLETRAKGAASVDDLQKMLGKPTTKESIEIVGRSAERWTYKAKDGEVIYLIANGSILSVARKSGESSEKK